MKTTLSLLRLEARRSLALWLVPIFTVLTVYVALGELPEGVWLWPHTSVALQSTLVLVGPLAAGLGAWVAARNRRRSIEELLSTTPLSSAVRDLMACAAAAVWISLGYGLAAVGLLSFTSLYATWGLPNAGPILAGLFALIMFCSLGYTVGHFLPRIFTAVLVAILAYLVQGFTGFFLFSYLSPVATAVPDVFYGLFPRIFPIQTVWFIGVSVASLGLIALKTQKRNVVLWLSLLAVSLPTGAAAGMLVTTDPSVSLERADVAVTAYDPICEEREIPVCVHPAYARLLPEVATTIDGLAQPLINVPQAPIQAAQTASQPAILEPNGTLAFFLYDEEALNHQLPVELAYALVQSKTANERDQELTEVQAVIAAYLARSAGVPNLPSLFYELNDPTVSEAFSRFSKLSPEKRRAWLKENYGKVREGQLSLEDLP